MRRSEPGAPIRWQCSVCNDGGVVSNWEASAFDLRRESLAVAETVNEIAVSYEVAAALRELVFLDRDGERVVFGIRAHHDHAILTVSDEDLDELVGYVAAEANNETNRRTQQRFDTAYDALTNAAEHG